jgi:hypothetical protein
VIYLSLGPLVALVFVSCPDLWGMLCVGLVTTISDICSL